MNFKLGLKLKLAVKKWFRSLNWNWGTDGHGARIKFPKPKTPGAHGAKVVVILTSKWGGGTKRAAAAAWAASLSTGEESVRLHLKCLIRGRWWFRNMWVAVKAGLYLHLCRCHSLLSITHIILIWSLGFIPGEQQIVNNSLFCRSLSSNHLNATD